MRHHLAITLVVPLRDEEESFDDLRRSIDRQTRDPDAVILVDAGSTDSTLRRARDACTGRPMWHVIEAGPATPGRARNVGIAAAATAWVALADAGTELDRGWLDRLVRFAEAVPHVDVVFGSYQPAATSWFTRCAALAYVAPLAPGPTGPVRDRSVASMLVRTDVWRRAGGFPDLRAAEDRIFMRRLVELGAHVATSPEATLRWHLASTPAATFRRFRTYSHVNVLAGEQPHWHHGVRRLYVAGAVSLPLARVDRRLLAVPLLAALLRAARSVWVRRAGRGAWWALNPARILTTACIIGVVDTAMFVGWVDALSRRRRP